MKTLLIALNAKYTHTSLALLCLQKSCREEKIDVDTAEYTINQPHGQILYDIVRRDPQSVGFSCYIWNITQALRLARDVKKVLPGCTVFLGGPEVSYGAKELLQAHRYIDIVLCGEGEQALPALMRALARGATPSAVASAAFWENGVVVQNPGAEPLCLQKASSPYEGADLSIYEEKILYYETSRGCPFRCGYCLSSVSGPVRFYDERQVEADLLRFLHARVRQVKFVDRTFNCDAARAMRLWRFLAQHDNGVTNFHFEIAAELLDEPTLAFFETVRPGLFQLEIGVQSCNEQTLEASSRPCSLPRLFENIRRLRKGGNVHLHLDLIAGLPHEDYQSFGCSFDTLWALGPHQLQLGFLKLLKGSDLRARARQLSLVFSDDPPYEILANRWLDFSSLERLRQIAQLVEWYANSGHYAHTLAYIISLNASAFAFFEGLARRFDARGDFTFAHKKFALAEKLLDFADEAACKGYDPLLARALLRHDLLLRENLRVLPAFLANDAGSGQSAAVRTFYDRFDPTQIGISLGKRRFAAQSALAFYDYLLPGYEKGDCAVLYDYTVRDIDHNCRTFMADLSGGKAVPFGGCLTKV